MCLFSFAFARVTSLHVSMVYALTYTHMSFIAGRNTQSQKSLETSMFHKIQ